MVGKKARTGQRRSESPGRGAPNPTTRAPLGFLGQGRWRRPVAMAGGDGRWRWPVAMAGGEGRGGPPQAGRSLGAAGSVTCRFAASAAKSGTGARRSVRRVLRRCRPADVRSPGSRVASLAAVLESFSPAPSRRASPSDLGPSPRVPRPFPAEANMELTWTPRSLRSQSARALEGSCRSEPVTPARDATRRPTFGQSLAPTT